jgi:hypothetical protein
MAHYAVLNPNNIVVNVFVGKDETTPGTNWEEYYSQPGARVKRTSYNTIGGVHILGGVPFRKNYAGIGFSYSDELDAFIPPKPEGDWVLNPESCLWEEVIADAAESESEPS